MRIHPLDGLDIPTVCGHIHKDVFAAFRGRRTDGSPQESGHLGSGAGGIWGEFPVAGAALPPRPGYAVEISVGYAMMVLVVTLQNRVCQIRRPVALTVEIMGWLFCLAALCYGPLSPYLMIPVMKAFSLLIFCFKIGSAVYLLGTALRAVRQQVPQAAPLFFAAAFYATLLLWDRLLPAFEPVVTGWFGEWGSFAMTLVIGYVLWRDRLRAVRRPRDTAGSCCAIWRISPPFWHGGPGCKIRIIINKA